MAKTWSEFFGQAFGSWTSLFLGVALYHFGGWPALFVYAGLVTLIGWVFVGTVSWRAKVGAARLGEVMRREYSGFTRRQN